MRTAFAGLVRKEFRQVFRDRNMLRIIFMAPIIQLLLFGYVVNTEVKQIALDIYDFDRSRLSRELVDVLGAGDYFLPVEVQAPLRTLEHRFQDGTAEMTLVIPPDFSEKLVQGSPVQVGLVADGTNSNSALIGQGYAARIAQQFSQKQTGFSPFMEIRRHILYNPEAESVYFMVPGIVATLLTMVSVMLTSMGIVRERERGTLEQLLVTPISTTTLLLGKITPFAILAMFEMVLALTVGVLWFGIPFVGSPLLLFALSVVYLLGTLGIGLFFSTVTTTQQQAMFFAWFFSIFAILTSGFFTPVSNMPQWLQYITCLNPMRFFMNIVRGIMMKGAGVGELLSDIATLSIYAVAIFLFAALRFSKR
ncbi:MAG: ABC transporter permease [Candidatus Zixiibacteriota bacterium]